MVILTICTEAYYKQWKVLYNSIKKTNSWCDIALLYVGDRKEFPGDVIILTEEQVKPHYKEVKEYYKEDIGAYLSTLRPAAMKYLMRNKTQNFTKVLSLGADCELFDSIKEIQNLLDKYRAIVTPHITSPITGDHSKAPNDLSVAKTGHINGDFLALYRCVNTIKFLDWFEERLDNCCVNMPQHGLFYDQTWLNFLPFIMDGVYILRNSGYNVAYWNYFQRDLKKVDGKWHTKDGPLVMFHYSGFDRENPQGISRYQNKNVAEGDFLEFLKEYARKIK